MKCSIEEGGTMLLLEAQCCEDLEVLSDLVGVHANGPLSQAVRVITPEGDLPFKLTHPLGQCWLDGTGLRVMSALRVRLAWLAYSSPKDSREQLRADAAARIGHGILDALELVRSHAK